MNAIEFENIGKLYQLGSVGTGTLSHDLNRWWQTKILGNEDPYLEIGETNDRTRKSKSGFVWALRDISFNVEEGDVVGIIGPNGAGKSTLLKILSHITTPTTGEIRGWGRIASLLEVGTGFHPEMTGRENIFMNGAILGMTRHEINRKLEDIVDFAGIERYLDTPVKRYSSGMRIRLGFSIAAFLEPEILVVDEVLAVGDAEFQKKAIGRMHDLSQGAGRTVLFVSHNMAAVRSLCRRGIVLKDGQVVYDGPVGEAIEHYISGSAVLEDRKIVDCIRNKKSFVDISKILINGTELNKTALQPHQEYLDVIIRGNTREPLRCDVKFIIKKADGTPMAALIEGRYKGKLMEVARGPFEIRKHIRLPRYMANGDYVVDLFLHQPLIQDFFTAPNCLRLHIEGFYDEYATPIVLRNEGFIGLQSE